MQKSNKFTIGIIGADTTHVSAFVEALTCSPEYSQEFDVLGIYDDALTDKDFFIQRKEAVKLKLDKLGFKKTDDNSFLEQCDGLLLLSGDADVHLQLFKTYARKNQAVFIDKPATYVISEYQEIVRYANEHHISMFSSSAMRFTEFVKCAKAHVTDKSEIVVSGPLSFIQEIPDYHWYGIHLLEILDEIVDTSLKITSFNTSDTEERIQFKANNQQLEMIGIKVGNPQFKVCVDGKNFELEETLYEALLKEIAKFMKTSQSPVSTTERIMSLLEEINQWKREADKI